MIFSILNVNIELTTINSKMWTFVIQQYMKIMKNKIIEHSTSVGSHLGATCWSYQCNKEWHIVAAEIRRWYCSRHGHCSGTWSLRYKKWQMDTANSEKRWSCSFARLCLAPKTKWMIRRSTLYSTNQTYWRNWSNLLMYIAHRVCTILWYNKWYNDWTFNKVLFTFIYSIPQVYWKGILTLVTGGWNLRNNRDRYRQDQEEKIKLFQKMSVRPSVRAQKLCTLKLKNRNCRNFDPNARRLTKLVPNEIFNDFAISREPFDEIDSNFFYFKGMD